MNCYFNRKTVDKIFADAIASEFVDKHGRYVLDMTYRALVKEPATDVFPIIHGKWERIIPSKNAAKWSTKVACSVCRASGYERFNYCPNCGAKMDKE